MSAQHILTACAVTTSLVLIGCKDKDDNHDHQRNFKCSGDRDKDMKNMEGCWVGNSTDQDFWVNLKKDGDDFEAKMVWGPRRSEGKGVISNVRTFTANFTDSSNGDDGAELNFNGYQFTSGNRNDDNDEEHKDECSTFSTDKLQMWAVDCNKKCSLNEITGTWYGTNSLDNTRDFKIVLDNNNGANHGTGKWIMDNNGHGGNDITWVYDTDLPDAALVITGHTYNPDGSDNITRFIPGGDDNDDCSIFEGQKGVAGADIQGVNMRLTRDEHNDDHHGNWDSNDIAQKLNPNGNDQTSITCQSGDDTVQAMAGCYKGHYGDQDLWVNLYYEGKGNLDARSVLGPKKDQGELSRVYLHTNVQLTDNNQQMEFKIGNNNDVMFRADNGRNCASWSGHHSGNSVVLQKEKCPVSCHKAADIICKNSGVWKGTNSKKDTDDFEITFDNFNNSDAWGISGTGKWKTMGHNHHTNDIKWWYNPFDPAGGLVIEGPKFTTFWQVDDQNCDRFQGINGNKHHVAGYRMELRRK